jgi:solute carrier family 13 (sodium-dependent dicarboxylate transporter), member 2/3/5
MIQKRGAIIVPAAADDGPSAKPLYPAAYAGIIAFAAGWDGDSAGGAEPHAGISFGASVVIAMRGAKLLRLQMSDADGLPSQRAAMGRESEEPGRDPVVGAGIAQPADSCSCSRDSATARGITTHNTRCQASEPLFRRTCRMSISRIPLKLVDPSASLAPTTTPGDSAKLLVWFKPAMAAVAAVLLAWAAWTLPSGLSSEARIATAVFGAAIIGWTLTRLGDTMIALAAALVLVAAGVVTQEELHAALGNELIWLLVAAFVMAAALRASGVAERAALALVSRFAGVRSLFMALTAVLAATALIIPSTSGRAALALPVFLALADRMPERGIARALALLFPTVILLSAGGSLIGAGAHLIAVDFIRLIGGKSLGYLDWLLIGMPLALVMSFAAAEIILRLFLTAHERSATLAIAAIEPFRPAARDLYLIGVMSATMLLWMTASWHGFGIAIVTLFGALAATLPGLSPVSLKDAVKKVEWDLLLFMAATLMMGEALLATNADEWAARRLVMAIGGSSLLSPAIVLAAVIAIALAAHLVVTSRTARATVLIPTVALPLAGLGLDPTALILATVMGTGFCQTLATSAKPVALYANLERETYAPTDLLRLSLALAPMMAAALFVFAMWIWPLQGVALQK